MYNKYKCGECSSEELKLSCSNGHPYIFVPGEDLIIRSSSDDDIEFIVESKEIENNR